jgi:hypothetical protein
VPVSSSVSISVEGSSDSPKLCMSADTVNYNGECKDCAALNAIAINECSEAGVRTASFPGLFPEDCNSYRCDVGCATLSPLMHHCVRTHEGQFLSNNTTLFSHENCLLVLTNNCLLTC